MRSVSWAMATLGVNKIDLLKIDVEGGELVRNCTGPFSFLWG